MFKKHSIIEDNDSSELCFSIPVHEKQDVINNQIENILNFNPNAKIVIHVNKSFKEFKKDLTQYDNVYINRNQYNYVFGKGLLWIHIQNFIEMLNLNVNFKYFIIFSSNEMFIREGCIQYIKKHKNGLQCVEFDKSVDWHNFHKGLENDKILLNLMKDLSLEKIYGGQTEGQFYERDIFNKIKDIYLKHFGERELYTFETEEIVIQTIFKGLCLFKENSLNIGLPITIQNYSNKIYFNEEFINNIIHKKDFIIPSNKINGNLISAHAGIGFDNGIDSIYSIKRVDRTFNDIRMLLTMGGFIMNDNKYVLERTYYSHGCEIKLLNNYTKHIHFKKTMGIRPFQWFGYNIVKGGFYNCYFKVKVNKKIGSKWGIKIECSGLLYNHFNKKIDGILGKWIEISFPFQTKENSMLLFYFDDCFEELDMEFKNIVIEEKKYYSNNSDNIAIVLYNSRFNKELIKNKNKLITDGGGGSVLNNDIINYDNIYNNIFKPLETLYDTYIFLIIDDEIDNDLKNKYLNKYLPVSISFNKNINNSNKMNDIFIKCLDEVIIYKLYCNIEFKFIIMFDIESIFTKNITDFNFYINKFNFISYYIPYINNKIANSYEFISFPYKYIDNVCNLLKTNYNNKTLCYELYWRLKDTIEIKNFNFIFDENYASNGATPLIKYKEDIKDTYIRDGFLFNYDYIDNITYYNKNRLATLIKENNSYHFLKNITTRDEPYIWIGLWIDLNGIKQNFNGIIKIKFSIKIINSIEENNSLWGIKTHDPLCYYKDWINNCVIGEYTNIDIDIKINKNSQYIIFCFDNFRDSLDIYIRDFKIIIDY